MDRMDAGQGARPRWLMCSAGLTAAVLAASDGNATPTQLQENSVAQGSVGACIRRVVACPAVGTLPRRVRLTMPLRRTGLVGSVPRSGKATCGYVVLW